MYEFDARYRRAMSGMGWADSFTSGGNQLTSSQMSCTGSASVPISGGHKICAMPDEAAFMNAQGCLGRGEPCSSSYGNGTIYCCGSGRPGTAATAQSERSSYTSTDIRRLQTAINAAGGGCSAGTVDGVWGDNSQRGLDCWAARIPGGLAAIVSQFPFLSVLVSTAPGGGKSTTYVQPGGSVTTGGGAPARQPATPPPTPPPADEGGDEGFDWSTLTSAWYFWAGLAAVAAVGIGGIAYYQHKKSLEDEDEDMSSEMALAR